MPPNVTLAAHPAGAAASGREHGPWLVAGLLLLAVAAGAAIAMQGNGALFLMLAVVACIFTFMDFRVGVVLLILLLPISNSSIFPHQLLGVTGLNPLNVLLFGTLAAYYLRNRPGEAFRGFMPRQLLWLYIVPIMVAGFIGMRHAGDIAPQLIVGNLIEFSNGPGYLRDVVVKPLFFVLFALLVSAAVARTRDPERFLIPTVVSVCIMSALVVLFVYLSGYSLEELSSSTARAFFLPLGMQANDLGRLYAVAYGLLLFTFARTTHLELKLPLLIAMGAVVVALVMTFSRGAFVGFMLINMLFLLSRRSMFTFLVFAVVLGVGLVAAPGAVYERVAAGMDGNLNALTAGRTEEIWLPLVPEMFKSPLWGNGLLSITWSDAMTHNLVLPVTHPHNAYLQAYMDMGILGMGLLLAFFVSVWKGFRRLSKDPSLSPGLQGFFAGAAAGLLSLLVAGMAGGSLVPSPEQTYLWLAIGVMYGEQLRRRLGGTQASTEPGTTRAAR